MYPVKIKCWSKVNKWHLLSLLHHGSPLAAGETIEQHNKEGAPVSKQDISSVMDKSFCYERCKHRKALDKKKCFSLVDVLTGTDLSQTYKKLQQSGLSVSFLWKSFQICILN